MAVRKSKIPIKTIAEEAGYTGRHMYNLFETEELALELFIKIGKIIGHDFSNELPELAAYSVIKEPEVVYETNLQYKQKYLELLEKHVQLIEEMKRLKDEYEKGAPSEPGAPKVRQNKKSK